MEYTYDHMIFPDNIVCQPKSGAFRFGCDSAILAWFTNAKKNWHIADVGSGSGIIASLIYRKYGSKITAIEIQPEMYSCLLNTVNKNNYQDHITTLNKDIRDIKKEFNFDAIVCNPPYRNLNTGKIAPDTVSNIARFTITMNILDLVLFAKRNLKNNGKLFFSYDADLLSDALFICKNNNLEPKRILFLHKDHVSKAKIVFVECSLNGGIELTIEPPLFQYGDNNLTKRYNDIFNGNWI